MTNDTLKTDASALTGLGEDVYTQQAIRRPSRTVDYPQFGRFWWTYLPWLGT